MGPLLITAREIHARDSRTILHNMLRSHANRIATCVASARTRSSAFQRWLR